MPMYNKDSKFDIDLKFGEKSEEELYQILASKGTIEVKSERSAKSDEKKKKWNTSGNLAIEVQSRGKLSGLVTTESYWWATILNKGDEKKAIIIIPTKDIKKYTKNIIKSGRGKTSPGGDDNTSELALIKITHLMEEIINDSKY